MRIRKGLLVASTTSYMQTASDPQPTNELHPITTNSLQHKPITHFHPSDPSYHTLTKTLQPHPNPTHLSQINQKVKLEDASREEEKEENGAGTRKQNIVFADAPVTGTVEFTPLSSSQVDGRWFDVDTTISLKKRKLLTVENTGQETLSLEKAKKMRSKTNKKCSTTSVQQNNGEQDKAGNDDSNSTNDNMNVDKTTNKRGCAIKEGSRCSRVNGRGWRCCQQTLVGYSLCEHHLGKGRLRSITNMKGRAKMPTAAPTAAPHNDDQPAKKVLFSSPSVVQPPRDYNKETILLDGSCYDDDEDKEEGEEDDDFNDEEMKKPLVVKKKRMKLGMVKARSLSSLLNQTNNAVEVASDDN